MMVNMKNIWYGYVDLSGRGRLMSGEIKCTVAFSKRVWNAPNGSGAWDVLFLVLLPGRVNLS